MTVDAMGCQKKIAGKITEKKSDYVFSLKGNQEKIHDDVKAFFSLTDAGKACEAMRSHWGVENGLHWELDVVFGEDLSQLRKDNSAANMNIIRKLVINILKQIDFSEFTKAKCLSILGKQMLCDKREDCLEKVCRYI